ncbi:hypothetical protein M2360_001404 [Rhizobium sp. SG_E_25_P2]|uniref:hypothetical protein n=1 Tax=Rhizobium sp. SG_E_25_P2 TaxID=2879942 RepID=UPI0024744680|nr:hypothetical protein [Rhizobium sp. SG_E_25_P2]MDH6266008.1 hypothetical protein [Rhizobium sp. SG_E_25_P2]
MTAIVVNSRGPTSPIEFTARFGGSFRPTDVEEAQQSDIVILAMGFGAGILKRSVVGVHPTR